MSRMTLVIGSPHLSTWSLRAWLAMRHFGLDFAEITIELDRPDTMTRILEHSPAGRVPVLKYGNDVVWESLAIVEYLAERHPDLGIWPADPGARARARSLAAEMHAGFSALREEFPMDLRDARPGRRPSLAASADIGRICGIWRSTRDGFGGEGPFLFGAFGAVDAMFAPVAVRFRTYGLELGDAVAGAYGRSLWSQPALVEWRRKAGSTFS